MLESRERDYKLSDPLRNYKNARVLPRFRHDVDPRYMEPARFLAGLAGASCEFEGAAAKHSLVARVSVGEKERLCLTKGSKFVGRRPAHVIKISGARQHNLTFRCLESFDPSPKHILAK